MSTPAHQTISNEVMDRVERLINSREKPTPFELKRLEADAAKLAGVDAESAALARAGIAALTWDIPRLREQIRNVLHLSGANVRNLLNATIFSAQVNDHATALEHARRAWNAAPNDEDVGNHFVACLLRNGHLREVARLAPDLVLSENERRAAIVQPTIEGLDALGVTEERLQAELQAMYEVLSARRIRSDEVSYKIESDPEDGAVTVVYQVCFKGDFDDEEALAGDLSERLAASPGWNPDQFTIEFIPSIAEEDELQLA